MKKYKSQGKAIELIVNSKEEITEYFCLDFTQEFGLGLTEYTCSLEPSNNE